MLKPLKKTIIWVGLAAFFVTLGYLILTPKQTFNRQYLVVPELRLQDSNSGKQFSLRQLKGKPYVMHFWATWCGVCLKEHRHWAQLSQDWDQSVPLVGINFQDDIQAASGFLRQKGNPYQYNLSDITGQLGIGMGLLGTPETFVVDASGRVCFRHTGPIDANFYRYKLLPAIQKCTQ